MSFLCKFLEFSSSWEVPVSSFNVFRQLHDVITMAVPASPNHTVQHVVVVIWWSCISNEEKTSFVTYGTKWHGLAHYLEGFTGLVIISYWEWKRFRMMKLYNIWHNEQACPFHVQGCFERFLFNFLTGFCSQELSQNLLEGFGLAVNCKQELSMFRVQWCFHM